MKREAVTGVHDTVICYFILKNIFISEHIFSLDINPHPPPPQKTILSIWGNTTPAFGMFPYYGNNNVKTNISPKLSIFEVENCHVDHVVK